MIIPSIIWKNKTCSKPPTTYTWQLLSPPVAHCSSGSWHPLPGCEDPSFRNFPAWRRLVLYPLVTVYMKLYMESSTIFYHFLMGKTTHQLIINGHVQWLTNYQRLSHAKSAAATIGSAPWPWPFRPRVVHHHFPQPFWKEFFKIRGNNNAFG